MKKQPLYIVITIGASAGLIASFLQTLEKLTLLKQVNATPLVCDLNSVFSCTNVLNAWQSSVFGFPNSLMCIVFFTLALGIGLAGATGGVVARSLRLALQGISLFFLCFGLWFLGQSTYVIGSLCIFCIFCFAGLLLINAAWLRLNAWDLPLGDRINKILARAINRDVDLVAWFVLGAAVALAMMGRFY